MSRRRVLDTNVLINHWKAYFKAADVTQIGKRQAIQCARRLIELTRTDEILSPIYVEYLCGPQGAAGVAIARDYLDEFTILDEGRIVPEDWEEAKRIAVRVRRDQSSRQLGDCLIRAVCIRLRRDVHTFDRQFPF